MPPPSFCKILATLRIVALLTSGQIGHENATALLTVFKLFHQFGYELSIILRQARNFTLSQSIQDGVGNAFVDLLNIVASIAIHFHQAVRNTQSFVIVDVHATFGGLISAYRSQVLYVAQDIWTACLELCEIFEGPSVKELRRWLAPQDSVLAFLSSNHVNLTNQPEEKTCIWFQQHLVNFLRGEQKVFAIEGKTGSGKSTLATWATERLQRPIARKTVGTLSFSFNQNIPAQSTTLAMVKTLLYQLLEQRVGDVTVYRAIKHAFENLRTTFSAEEHESTLWKALTQILTSLDNADSEEEKTIDHLALVIDGLDEMRGQKKAAVSVCNRLQELAHQYKIVKLIHFSEPLEMTATRGARLTLTLEQTSDDLHTILHKSLSRNVHFVEQAELDQEKIVERLAGAADGSLLWAGLAANYVRMQSSHASTMQALETLFSTPRTVPDAVQKLLSTMQLDSQEKNLLSWLVAAERPLTLAEISLLSQVNVERGTMKDHHSNIDAVIRSVRPFVVISEGLIALRHLQVKHALVNIPNASKNSLQITERQRDLLIRLLIYTKSYTKDQGDLTFSGWEFAVAESRFQSQLLLEYAVRYWAVHFKKSSWFRSSGSLEPSGYFKEIFPSSVTLAVLEKTCWDASPFPAEALELHLIASRVRQAIFGESYLCVLQTAISCATILETLSRTTEAITWCASATRLCSSLISVQSETTVTCCTWLLRISESFVTKQRTDVMTFRETAYQILVKSYTHRYGASSKQVLAIYEKLVELYVFISEEIRATEIRKIIHEITIKIYGAHSQEVRTISGHLDVVLRAHEEVEDVDTFDFSLFGGFWKESVEELTIVYVNQMIILAEKHISCGRFAAAEEIYIELWLKLTEHCKSTEVLEWHEKKIHIMLTYALFLETRKRISESSSILLCIWREYEFHAFATVESIIMQLKHVAVIMARVSLHSVALQCFKKCWSFFKSTSKEETEIFKEIEEHITIVSKTIIETTSKTTLTSSSESVMREVFQSSISESTTEISSTTIDLCKSLSSIYLKEERYSEAIKCTKSVLKKSWSSFFSSSLESITLSSSFSSTHIDLVIQLASCYLHQRRFEKCEQIYVRLYRALRCSRRIDDSLVIKYSQTLVAFYIEHKFYQKAISFHQELLVEYRAFYGASHSITIKCLYSLGEICRTHQRTHGYWLEYYLEIIRVLVGDFKKGDVVCHHDALQALVIVAECYFEDSRHSEALTFFRIIATTFFKHGIQYKFFEQITEVQRIFERFQYSLEESKTDVSMQISILKEYRESCVRHFGASASITVSATLQYASVCEKSESHHFEAISHFEQVMKHSSSTEIVRRCKSTLRSLYVKKVTSTTTTEVSQSMVESATTLVYERYLEIQKTHSCVHETTLRCLKELIMFYAKQSKVEIAVKELRGFIVRSISEVSSSKELIEIAKHVAEIYRSCTYFEHAHNLVKELKMQVIFKSTSNASKIGFNVTHLSRSCFAFIAAFERHILIEQAVTVTELMAELVAVSLYYEHYSEAIKSKSKIDVVFASASRLRQILSKRKRIDFFWTIERQVFEYFCSTETRVVGFTSTSAIKVFVTLLLEHFGEHRQFGNFIAAAGYAASARIRALLEQKKFTEAFELCKCTYKFLMMHEGLDDESEIGQGFALCLMMAGRGYNRCPDAALNKNMLELSKQILREVLDICQNSNINLARCRIQELNELICLMGEQQDYEHLQVSCSTSHGISNDMLISMQWLLNQLWETREGQTSWTQSNKLSLAIRLIQTSFTIKGKASFAIQLAEDVLYNVRCVHGSRSSEALVFFDLLTHLHTSHALQQGSESKSTRNSYLKKAMNRHEEVLKLFVHANENSDDEDDSDFGSDAGSSSGAEKGEVHGDEELKVIRTHLRLLKLSFQRLGTWSKHREEFVTVTNAVWEAYGVSLKMDKRNVLCNDWSAQGFGDGKAEASEDLFSLPKTWSIL